LQITDFSDIIIICGHYGCGKTNLALNMAADFASRGEAVTLVDLDIVNPYFRSSDYADFIQDHNIEIVAPTFAHSNLDLPALPAEMYSIFTRKGRRIIDVGGDDAGATALGRFARQFQNVPYTMLYVINKYRIQSQDPATACELLREIEQASRLKAHYVVNNSHLMEYTTADTIIDSMQFADQTAQILSMSLAFTAAQGDIAEQVQIKTGLKLYPVDIIVKKPWEV